MSFTPRVAPAGVTFGSCPPDLRVGLAEAFRRTQGEDVPRNVAAAAA